MGIISDSGDSRTPKALFVIVDVTERVAPLVAGYLQAAASLDPLVKDRWTFETFVCTSKITPASFLRPLLKADADVYAFSCYVWNMGLIKKILPLLLERKPNAHMILGGPQVMHCAEEYLFPDQEQLVLCNGEGELTFRAYLAELSTDDPHLSRVKGLSFYQNGQLTTTEDCERIKDLDAIPSPYLNGYIDLERYTNAHLETNRGCPFKCQYCYWGGAVAARVNKMHDDRVKDEITRLAQHKIFFIFIVDANFGMLERDVQLAAHVVSCRETYGFPMEVGFCSSKNTPERVSRITKIFRDAGMLTSQSIALQTMSQDALVKVSRDNIKQSTYERLQEDLNEQGISSYIEIIWPLPGETFESFKSGIARLCEAGAESLVFYPLLLMNNVELNANKDDYGLVTERTQDPNSEAELVIQTKEVAVETCVEGWRLIFSVVILYNARALFMLSRYLHEQGQRSYADLFNDFVHFLKAHPDDALAKLCEEIIDIKAIEFWTLGRVIHHVCHEQRDAVDRILADFASIQPWWQDRMAQAFFEADLINRLYAYSNTELRIKDYAFRHLEVLDVTPDGYVVLVPNELISPLQEVLGEKALFDHELVYVCHGQKQLPYMTTEAAEHNYLYCMHKLNTIGDVLPQWQDVDVDAALAHNALESQRL